jgi:hypothetical protein
LAASLAAQTPVNLTNGTEDVVTGALLSPDGQYVAYAVETGGYPGATEKLRLRRADLSAAAFDVSIHGNAPTGFQFRYSFTWRHDSATNRSFLVFVNWTGNGAVIYQKDPQGGSVSMTANANATTVTFQRNPGGDKVLAVWPETPYRMVMLSFTSTTASESAVTTSSNWLQPWDIDPSGTYGLYQEQTSSSSANCMRIQLASPHNTLQVSTTYNIAPFGFLNSSTDFYLVPDSLRRLDTNSLYAAINSSSFETISEAYAQPGFLSQPASTQNFIGIINAENGSPTATAVRLAGTNKGGQVLITRNLSSTPGWVSMDSAEQQVCFVDGYTSGPNRIFVEPIDREVVSTISTTSTTAQINFTIRSNSSETPFLFGAASLATTPWTVPTSPPGGVSGLVQLDQSTLQTLAIGQNNVTLTTSFNSSMIGTQLFFQVLRSTGTNSGNLTHAIIARFF